MPNGIPSADTFARVFQRLKSDEFLRCLSSVVAVLRTDVEQEVVAIDGQTLRGSGDDRAGRHPLHLVRAWATTNRLVLGPQACAEKSNEITAIPQLLKRIDIAGTIVTIDAMGCQTEIADTIIEHSADYVLAVKHNQPELHTEIRETFEYAMERAGRTYKINVFPQSAPSDNWRCDFGLFKSLALRGEFGLSDDLNRDRRRATDGSLLRAEGMDRVCGVARGGVGRTFALSAAAVVVGGGVRGRAADGDDVVARRDTATRRS